ncbi:PAS domain-containing protein, partial [Janthinobacterium sp. CG_23.3]|uniref:PAS domain-containing protein n=1 Tax=Janthinobacterium sp. CG_23.3 TaxID=3349634 RepID=UPI0038D37D19
MNRSAGGPAEAALMRAQAEQPGAGPHGDMHRQLHALRVSQFELEMQSAALAELQLIKDEFEVGLNHYAELYELAPASYFSIERGGRISRANVAAAALLRSPRSELLGRQFEQFIAPEGQRRFRDFIDAVFDSGARQVLEVALFRGGGEEGGGGDSTADKKEQTPQTRPPALPNPPAPH